MSEGGGRSKGTGGKGVGGKEAGRAEERYPYGPRPIGALVPGVTRPAFRKQSPAGAQLLADWPSIVGPALAGCVQPKRVQAGTLTLLCAGPVALELQHLAGQLIERINGHVGRELVQRLRFVQGSVAPAAAPAAPRRRPSPAAVPGLPEGPLRDALAALGGAMGLRGSDDPA